MAVTFLTNEDKTIFDEQIAQLSEEIESLKKEGGTSTPVSGTLITLDYDEGDEIVVEGETTDAVTLVHCGKNLLPRYVGPSAVNGATLTVDTDGKITIGGKVTADCWPDYITKASPMYLPAGTYTLKADGLWGSVQLTICDLNTNVIARVTMASNPTPFTLAEGTYLWGFFTLFAEDIPNIVVSAQIEIGSAATEYAPYNGEKLTNITLPKTLTAHAGVNTIYTETGDMLTVQRQKSVATIIDEAVAKRLSVDWADYGLPVLHLTGDTSAMTKDDAVDLAYVYGDMSGIVSVKWQGSSSLSYPKKNYTIKFDNAFEAKEGWGAQTKYCFKANFIDHTHARNLMCASIWGELVKSAVASTDRRYSLPNGGAVDGFPCIVMLNGEFHGLYTWNIPKDGWMLGMGSGTQECILCANGKTQPNADGFKTLETTLGTAFDVEYITDENNTDWALTSLNRMLDAVIKSDGSDLDTTVAQYLDWDSVIDHYIQTVLTGAADCTFKNYLLSTYDGVKWFFTGYDMDSTFGLYWNGKSFTLANAHPTFDSYANVHRAMELVKTYKKDALKARYSALRTGVLSEISITNKLTNYTAEIPSQVLDEDARKWPTIPSTSASNLAQMLNWYRLRVAVADAEIEAL